MVGGKVARGNTLSSSSVNFAAQAVTAEVYATSGLPSPYILAWDGMFNSGGHGSIATVTFRVIGEGNTDITITCEGSINEDLQEVQWLSASQEINLKVAAPTGLADVMGYAVMFVAFLVVAGGCGGVLVGVRRRKARFQIKFVQKSNPQPFK